MTHFSFKKKQARLLNQTEICTDISIVCMQKLRVSVGAVVAQEMKQVV